MTTAQIPRTGRAAPAPPVRRHGGTDRITRLLDGGTDLVIPLFALWTLVYDVGLLLRPPTSALLIAWAAMAVALLPVARRLGLLRAEPPAPATPAERRVGGDAAGPGTATGPRMPRLGRPGRERGPGTRAAAVRRAAGGASIAFGVAAGVSARLRETGVPWALTWSAGIVSVVSAAVALLPAPAPCTRSGSRSEAGSGSGWERPGPAEAGGEAPAAGFRLGSPFAVLVGLGFAVASLFMVNPDGDDAYFVSRSVWTAAHGRIPFNDVIFTQGATPPIAGEPPVASIEVLAGALARVAGVHAASLLFYAFLPAVTFLAVWAAWRLIRAWAPRAAVACLIVAMVYLLWSGTGTGSFGSFHLVRMWQGKAVFVSVVVPLLYAALTRWAERPSPRELCLLAATGVAAVGLTSTAVFVVPLIALAAMIPPLAAGRLRLRPAAAGIAAVTAYPVLAGLAVMAAGSDAAQVVGHFRHAATSYGVVLLTGTLGVLAGCALWTAPWLTRRGTPSLIGLGIAAMTTLLCLPGVFAVLGAASGAGVVLWRTMWIVPAPVLIGLLAALPLPRRLAARPAGRPARHTAGLAAGLTIGLTGGLTALVVAGGMPVWSSSNGSELATRPQWKTDTGALRTARSVIAADPGGGTVLMPPLFMRTMPLFTTRPNAVSPNTHYLKILPVDPVFRSDRLMLRDLAAPYGSGMPGPDAARAALRRVGVSIACVRPANTRGLRVLRSAGYGRPRTIGPLICLFPPA